MIARSFLTATASFLLCIGFAHAQRGSNPTPNRPVELSVRVTFDDDRAVPDQLRVQLLTGYGSTVSEQFTHSEGQVSFQAFAGSYRLRVSGMDIETAETSFSLESREGVHTEFVRVKAKPSTDQQTSTSAMVSASTLNIPDKARHEFDKGVSGMQKQDLADARKHFIKATEIYPQYSAAFNNLGVLSMKSGNTEEGKGFFEHAIRADENDASAYLNLARCLVMQKKIVEAEPLLVKSNSLDPRDPDALALLAKVELASGKPQLAATNAQKVHSLGQHPAVVHLIAAKAFETENKLDEAAEEYRTFLKESPDSPTAQQVRAALQSLENRVR